MDRFSFTVLVGAALVAGGGLAARAQADVYRAVDDQGVVHLTNVPTDPRYAILIQGRPERPPAAKPAVPVKRRAHAARLRSVVARAAREQDIDQALLKAVITVESGYDPKAVSSAGAVGLMQLMPRTAQRYGVTDRYDPVENVHAGAHYLHDLIRRFDDNLPLALAAYNAGEEAVVHYGNRIPPFRETRRYVPLVMDLYRRFRAEAH